MGDKKMTTQATMLLADKFNEMPMLKSIFSSFIVNSQISLSRHLNCNIDIEPEAIIHVDALEYSSSIKHNSEHIAIEYKFFGWNTKPFFIFIQKDTIYKMIEIILGGKNVEHSLNVENRHFSQIEQNFISSIVDILTIELQNVFLLADSNIKIIRQNIYYFQYECSDLKDDVIFLGRATIKIKESIGKIDIVIPYDTLLPIKSALIKSFSNSKVIQQDVWKNHIKNFISDIDVELTVEVEAIQTIEDIERMKVGDTIITNKNSSEAFGVKVNGLKIYDCRIGKVNEKIAVELITGIL